MSGRPEPASVRFAPARYGVTVSVTGVLCDSVPLVAVSVSVNVPKGVLLLVLTLIVVDPEVTIEFGVKLAVALAGSPLTANVTVPVKPPAGVTVAV